MIRALFYLQARSLTNRLLARLRRLKKPKYLAGAMVGGLYFYFYFFRWIFSGKRGGVATGFGAAPEHLAISEVIGALILFGLVLMAWIFPRERAALAFTEAEVQFLFPAPVSRRTLIHFKLLKSQTGILFSTLLLTLISRRFGGEAAAWIRAAGWWLILSTLSLHFLGASFARTLLLDRGISNWQRRLGLLAVLGAGLAGVYFWGRDSIPALQLETLINLDAITSYLRQASESGPAPYLLFPFKLLVRPYLAPSSEAFLHALGPVLVLMLLHYWWVIRSNVSFEEASLELSRKAADRVAALRAGRWHSGKKTWKRPPFELRPTGLQAVALLWKNLIGAGQYFTIRLWLILIWLVVMAAIFLGNEAKRSGVLEAISFFALMLAVMSLLLGPHIIRHDLRQDLPVADILKMYPMRGWQVVLGELLAPTVILTGVQWILLLIGVSFFTRLPGTTDSEVPLLTRAAFGLGAAMIFPMVDLISLLIPNAAVLLFPAWFQTGPDAPQGIEATGQRLIFVLGQLLVFLVAIVPAVIAFSILFFGVNYVFGLVLAVPLASMTAAVVLAIESGLALLWLGRVFERFDLSVE